MNTPQALVEDIEKNTLIFIYDKILQMFFNEVHF